MRSPHIMHTHTHMRSQAMQSTQLCRCVQPTRAHNNAHTQSSCCEPADAGAKMYMKPNQQHHSSGLQADDPATSQTSPARNNTCTVQIPQQGVELEHIFAVRMHGLMHNSRWQYPDASSSPVRTSSSTNSLLQPKHDAMHDATPHTTTDGTMDANRMSTNSRCLHDSQLNHC
jgi:hypothetical protein